MRRGLLSPRNQKKKPPHLAQTRPAILVHTCLQAAGQAESLDSSQLEQERRLLMSMGWTPENGDDEDGGLEERFGGLTAFVTCDAFGSFGIAIHVWSYELGRGFAMADPLGSPSFPEA